MQILSRLSQFDQRAFLWCANYCSAKTLVHITRIISKSGDGYMQVIMPVAIWVYLGQQAMIYFKLIAMAFIVERVIYWVIKNKLKRERPTVAIPAFTAFISASDEFSFPSGHTSAAFLLAIFTALSFPAMLIPLLFWAAAVGISRVILGVHFPADVLAGACLGSTIAYYGHQALLAGILP